MSKKVWVVLDTSDEDEVRVAGICASKKRAKDLAVGQFPDDGAYEFEEGYMEWDGDEIVDADGRVLMSIEEHEILS